MSAPNTQNVRRTALKGGGTPRDPSLEHAREDAEGTEILESPDRAAGLEKQREAAQGVEVFEDPDATLTAKALKEGAPGHEHLSADAAGLDGEDDDRERGPEEDEDER